MSSDVIRCHQMSSDVIRCHFFLCHNDQFDFHPSTPLIQFARSIKITFPDAMVAPADISEEEVRNFLAPTVPRSIALGWTSEEGQANDELCFDTLRSLNTAMENHHF